jgi:hypothetical protein
MLNDLLWKHDQGLQSTSCNSLHSLQNNIKLFYEKQIKMVAGTRSLLGGTPPFLGFEPIAWASLVGHLGLGIGIAGADAALRQCAA